VKRAAWLVTIAIALAVGLAGVNCGRDVPLGVDPGSDAAAPDASDGG
jgi:predicted small lipoprotein YifL